MVEKWLECHKWIKLGIKRCMRMRAGIEMELQSRADQRVLRWFGHVERIDEYRMARGVLMAEVSGGRVRGRPMLGGMDGVKMAVKIVKRLRDNARKIGKRSEPGAYVTDICSCNKRPILLGPVFFRTVLTCSGDYHLKKDGMSVHVVGVNCEKGANTETEGAGVKYMGLGVCVG